jgi:DNA polymerase-3 subunit epsilon
LLDFIDGAPIVAHNAAFDRGFVNHELERAGRKPIPETFWVCSLKLAQARHPGMYNSLDALCKRYKISLLEREKHGALIDVKLLAAVYFQLHAAEAQSLDLSNTRSATGRTSRPAYAPRPRPLAPRLSEDEAATHAAFVRDVLKEKALWLRMDA